MGNDQRVELSSTLTCENDENFDGNKGQRNNKCSKLTALRTPSRRARAHLYFYTSILSKSFKYARIKEVKKQT